MVTDYKNGTTITTLAVKYDINRTTAMSHIGRSNARIKRQRPVMTPTQIQQAIQDYTNGDSPRTL